MVFTIAEEVSLRFHQLNTTKPDKGHCIGGIFIYNKKIPIGFENPLPNISRIFKLSLGRRIVNGCAFQRILFKLRV